MDLSAHKVALPFLLWWEAMEEKALLEGRPQPPGRGQEQKKDTSERHFRKVPDTSEAGLTGVVDSACVCSVRANSGLELTS